MWKNPRCNFSPSLPSHFSLDCCYFVEKYMIVVAVFDCKLNFSQFNKVSANKSANISHLIENHIFHSLCSAGDVDASFAD